MRDAHGELVGDGFNSRQAIESALPMPPPPAGSDAEQDRTAIDRTMPTPVSLFDPALALAADILDDTEKVWVANANRLRQLTRSVEDKDGEVRGFGLDESHPDVARLAAMVDTLDKLTKDATKHLEKVMKRHPLGPWVLASEQKGLGLKQVARLLAAIGDPYWNELHDRPRTVSELWAYCGFHVLPSSHATTDTHARHGGGVQLTGGDTSHGLIDAHRPTAGVAPRRQRGQKANWSEEARKRCWLIAQSIVKVGGPKYRDLYSATKAKYTDAVHTSPCVRCGPAGKPAQPGTPLSKGHIDARARRAVAKKVLKELWRESKRLHETAIL